LLLKRKKDWTKRTLKGQGTLRPFEFCFNIEKSKIKFCPIFVFAFVISQTNFKILTRFSFFHFKIKQTKIKHSLPFLLFTFLLFRLSFFLFGIPVQNSRNQSNQSRRLSDNFDKLQYLSDVQKKVIFEMFETSNNPRRCGKHYI
jgi:hypothetical protein